MANSVTFLGAADTVTGSKFLVESAGKRILVDCGLFQGPREVRQKNWHDPDFEMESVDCVLLTHAHIDHTGLLPRYVSRGLGKKKDFKIYASKPTTLLAQVLLPDSGRLQEEEASYRKRKHRSRHKDPKPLYTEEHALQTLKFFKSIEIGKKVEILPGIEARWNRMGHILGACSIELFLAGKKIVFSGDIGRYGVPILKDPVPLEFGDLLLVESTYGDREHPETAPEDALAAVINETSERGGVTIIPSFAVGRVQLVLYYLAVLKQQNRIPDIPVVVDSPMALDASEIYLQCPQEYDKEMRNFSKQASLASFKAPQFTRSVDDSKRLNRRQGPLVIISASGMLTGGRILHHLKNRVSDSRNSVLLVGYQPEGSRGYHLLRGAKEMRFLGETCQVKASVSKIDGLSAHADRSEILRWCNSCEGNPVNVAVVHGERSSQEALAQTLKEKFSWKAFVPDYLQRFEIK